MTRLVALAVAALGCTVPRPEAPVTAAPGEGLTLEVDVPDATPPRARVYVAGTFNGWNPGDPSFELRRRDARRYTIALPGAIRGPIEFKFTLGSWESVEMDRAGRDVPNRGYTVPVAGRATLVVSVARWRDGSPRPAQPSTARPSVSILDTAFLIPPLGRTRRVWLYLPPDYATSVKRYPVIYMHDGQNVFDQATSFAGEWGVDETLDSLHAAGDHGAIVVAIDHGGARRFDEYSPWRNAKYGGGEGDAYVEFLVHTLKPWVDAHYRTRPDRLNTAIAGSSMGAVISLYAMLRYPHVFGRAGVFSIALWVTPEFFPFARAAAPVRPDPRIYFVAGGREGASREEAERYVADQARMVDTLAAAGFRRGSELAALVQPDGTHSESFWRREFPAAYQWLFR